MEPLDLGFGIILLIGPATVFGHEETPLRMHSNSSYTDFADF